MTMTKATGSLRPSGPGVDPIEHSPWVKGEATLNRWVRNWGKRHHYAEGQIIYFQEDPGSHLYYLEQGKVFVSIIGHHGSEHLLAIHEPGSFFGESAALDMMQHTATAVAAEPSVVHAIASESLPDILAHPEAAMAIMKSMARKVRLLVFHIEGLSFLDAVGKISHLLDELSSEYGVPGPDGVELTTRVTHQLLANLTGLSRVTATNVLTALRREGIIDIRRRQVIIKDQYRLKGKIVNS